MPLPRQLVYNDLTGEEVRHILLERVGQCLQQVPYLQRHLTLPRVKMTLQIHLDLYADQKAAERHTIEDSVEISSSTSLPAAEPIFSATIEDSVNAAPGPGGKPPDQVRDEHGLGIPTPARGTLNVTSLEDRVEGRRMQMANGSVVDRTGQSELRPNATVVTQDFGKAGLAEGQFNRGDTPIPRGGRDGQGVARPVFRTKDE
jgi:hypothetical protein